MEILSLFQARKRLDIDRLVSLIVERRTVNFFLSTKPRVIFHGAYVVLKRVLISILFRETRVLVKMQVD